MSRNFVILVLLFGASEAIGLAIGEWFFRLYLHAVPPMAHSTFNAQSSRIAHLFYGAGVGVALFLWMLVGALVSPLLWPSRKKDQKPAPIDR